MQLNVRNSIRLFFLLLIFVLWFIGKGQMWGPLVGLGLLLIPLWGRLYCGWICPIATSIDVMHPLLKKPLFNVGKDILRNRYFQGILVIVYVVVLTTFIKTGFRVPFFIFLIPVGLIITYLFGEIFWHRFCFFGIIYGWVGSFARRGYFLDSGNCTKCRACIKRCPNGCIIEDNDNYQIDNKHCLSCGKCKDKCPPATIQYGRLRGRKSKESKGV